jgi:hypothetical protein
MGVTIAIIAIVTPAARAGAASTTACTTTSGVTVLVDFSHFHRPISRGCAPGRPASALAAIQAAGFVTAGTTQYGDAFVCRIENLPSPQAEACTQTPPAKSSWSFYNARATDTSWTYTPVGVLGYTPPPGTIIAFAFGDMAKPGVAPSAAIRVQGASTPTTTAPPTTTPRTAAPTVPIVAPAAATTMPTIAAAPSTAARTEPTSTTTPATSTSIAPSSAQGASARIVDRPPITHVTVTPKSGSPVGALLALAIVVVLGVVTAFTVRSRRGHAA